MNLSLHTFLAAAAEASPPAGGAAIDQVVIATAGAMVVTGVLLFLGIGHRTGRVGLLDRIGGFSERVSGLPSWAAIPSFLVATSLIVALMGMMWDISLHIDDGRDEGPLANPAHYLILVGLFGVFAAGFLAMVLPKERPGATAVRITGDWYAPLGGVIVMACGAFSLAGFPLDDVWHRIFGQDVTLWGPTHLMLLGGAAMALLGQAILLVEARRASSANGHDELPWVFHLRRIALAGGLLIGLSIFQAEFDFGVPQFRFVFQPMLIAFAAGVALVATRVWLGAGAALGAVGFFLVIRGLTSLAVGPGFDEVVPHFPLYIVEALVVEAVALRIPPQRTLAIGAWSGLGIGTLGLASEWGWSHVWMPIAWPANLLPEAAVLGLAMALAGALLGAWVGARLSSDEVPRSGALRNAAVLAAVATFALVGYALYKPANDGVSAQVALTQAGNGPERMVNATVRLDPADAADDAEWFNVTSWQGGGFLLDGLEEVAPGVYESSEPIPVHGSWKTLVRLHDGASLTALPVYLPADSAIPAEGVPATAGFTREFVADHEILQREQKSAAGWLTLAAYLLVMAITLAFLTLIAWALHRLAVVVEPPPAQRSAAKAAPPRPAKRPTPVH